jgi:hypothetical protein
MSGNVRVQTRSPTTRLGNVRIVAWITLVVMAAYMIAAVSFTVYLVQDALFKTPSDFEKAFIGAVIAVVGTSITALGAIYTTNRQADAAQQVAILNSQLTADLDVLKAQSQDALERLKVGLDLSKTACRELFGAGTTLFYTMSEMAMGRWWDDDSKKKADLLMIDAARHLLYVDDDMRRVWLGFWTQADFVYREALKTADVEARAKELEKLMIARPQTPTGEGESLRDWHLELERLAKAAALAPITANVRT